ncbi:hypothetical protein [Rhizobium sp. KDH_Rht_773_N]
MTFKTRLDKPITAKRIERAMNRLAEIMVKLGPEGENCLPIYERLERELTGYRAREQKMMEVSERAKQSKASRAAKGGPLMGDSYPESARRQIEEWIQFHGAEIEAIEAGRLKHQTKTGDEPWRDTTEQILNHLKRSKEMHERHRQLLDKSE